MSVPLHGAYIIFIWSDSVLLQVCVVGYPVTVPRIALPPQRLMFGRWTRVDSNGHGGNFG